MFLITRTPFGEMGHGFATLQICPNSDGRNLTTFTESLNAISQDSHRAGGGGGGKRPRRRGKAPTIPSKRRYVDEHVYI